MIPEAVFHSFLIREDIHLCPYTPPYPSQLCDIRPHLGLGPKNRVVKGVGGRMRCYLRQGDITLIIAETSLGDDLFCSTQIRSTFLIFYHIYLLCDTVIFE